MQGREGERTMNGYMVGERVANAVYHAAAHADPVVADLDREGARTRVLTLAHQFIARVRASQLTLGSHHDSV